MRFALTTPLRSDFDAFGLRVLARTSKDAGQARRLLALAMIYQGGLRTEAAKTGGVTLQNSCPKPPVLRGLLRTNRTS